MDMFMKNSKNFFKRNKEILEDPEEDKYDAHGSLKREDSAPKLANTAQPMLAKPSQFRDSSAKQMLMNKTMLKVFNNPRNPYNINWQNKILENQFGVRVKPLFNKNGAPQFKLVKSAKSKKFYKTK